MIIDKEEQSHTLVWEQKVELRVLGASWLIWIHRQINQNSVSQVP